MKERERERGGGEGRESERQTGRQRQRDRQTERANAIYERYLLLRGTNAQTGRQKGGVSSNQKQ